MGADLRARRIPWRGIAAVGFLTTAGNRYVQNSMARSDRSGRPSFQGGEQYYSLGWRISTGEFFLKVGFDFRPFGIDDAEEHRVADAPAPGDHVVAEDSLLLAAHP